MSFEEQCWRWAWGCGLAGPREGTAADALARGGWARSVGGASPYLHIWSRTGLTRPDVDEALAKGEIINTMSVRGCAYTLPASDWSLALTMAQGTVEKAQWQSAKRALDVDEADNERLKEEVVARLTKEGEMDPRALRDALGDRVVSFGDAGKKVGISTNLALAILPLQVEGRIARVSVDGRLDHERYRYRVVVPPVELMDSIAADAAMADKFQSWVPDATQKQVQWFCGMTVKRASAAYREVTQNCPPRPDEPEIRFLSSFDSLYHLRRDARANMTESSLAHPVWAEIGAKNALTDLVCHAIADRGEVIGLWEYDLDREEVVWMTFSGPSSQVTAGADELQTMIREHLGDAASHSLDSMKRRAPRLAALRRYAT